ncbi:hypothetical protein P7H15_17975 [Paenibacillus larvae]|nr:hypothetical protein [Paenibacillus larvae]MDT2294325.1 hypothetical protein [Paenibacillus larvae]
MGTWQVEYLTGYPLPVLQVNMKKTKDDKHFVFHFFWGRQGKSYIKKCMVGKMENKSLFYRKIKIEKYTWTVK